MPQAFTPILDIHTTANTFGLDQNCYYCSVAALSNMTVEQFFRITEIMQQDTATPDEIVALWAAGNVTNVTYTQFVRGNDFDQHIVQKMPLGTGLGLAYTRANGSGHMVVLAKNDHGIVKCIDYQQNPPAIADFPPEENIVSVHVFYKQP
ncbi:MAG: hypothetical protein IM605_02500 [Cytophagales bacterium]|jgi:hypothetical protein|nr:hypothetical protein [Cytophagales bacterium]MCA6400879.1 hypothetical protein [Cytophagales bacterium]